jgi:HEAT repeat protein
MPIELYGRATSMQRALTIFLIVVAVPVTHAQGAQDSRDRNEVVQKAWAIVISALDVPNLQEQAAAVSALSAVDVPRALELVERVARGAEPSLRSTALWYLPANARNPRVLISEALKDSDVEVRRRAIEVIARFRDPQMLPLLQDVILSGDPDTLESAVSSARRLGPMAFGALLESVDKGGQRTREAAIRGIDWIVSEDDPSTAADNVEALRRLRPERVLIKALDDNSSAVRAFAALILARLRNGAGADELVRMSEASDPKFGTIVSRHYAMAALHVLGRPGYLAALAKALEHLEQRVRLDAAMALRSFAHPSMDQTWYATWRGTSPDDVRYWAFRGLVVLRGGDRELLHAGLVDRDRSIRLRAAEALLAHGSDPAAVQTLEALALEPSTRLLALSFLSTKGDPVRTAMVARSLLPDADDLVRMRSGHGYDPEYRLIVVNTLGAVRDSEAITALAALFGSDSTLNSYVARALVAIGDDGAGRALVRTMDSTHSTARIHAAAGVISVYGR